MLAVSPFCPPLEWEYQYPIEYRSNQAFDNLDIDAMFFANLDSLSDHDEVNKQQSESPQGTNTTDQPQSDNSNPVLAKKLNHNASERDRRKKINTMYSSLRALLPATDQRKKLSIPATVGKVLEYIPELQNKVKELTHKKKVLVSKLSALQPGNNAAGELLVQDETMPKSPLITNNQTTSCSISANKLGDNEMVIQISSFQRISMADVLLLLENNGFLVIDVSSFQSFGGTTFYTIHLWTESKMFVDLEKLNEKLLMYLLRRTTQKQIEVYS